MIRACLEPSRPLAAALLLIHAVAIGAIVPLELPLAIKVALALAVAASLVHSIRRHALLRAKKSVLAIEVRDQHTAAIQSRNRVWCDARILGTSYVSAQLTVLNLRVAGERLTRHVLLTRGNIDEQQFRRIRVLLRWLRATRPESKAAEARPE
jgi:hypothetical protein